MGKGLEEIPFKGVQVAKKHMEKKMVNITNHQRNVNYNYNERLP